MKSRLYSLTLRAIVCLVIGCACFLAVTMTISQSAIQDAAIAQGEVTVGAADRITVVAFNRARSGKEEQLQRFLQGIVAPARAEAGCINYDLYRDRKDGRNFVIYENWESQAALDRHFKAPGYQDRQRLTKELVAERQVLQLRMISTPAS